LAIDAAYDAFIQEKIFLTDVCSNVQSRRPRDSMKRLNRVGFPCFAYGGSRPEAEVGLRFSNGSFKL